MVKHHPSIVGLLRQCDQIQAFRNTGVKRVSPHQHQHLPFYNAGQGERGSAAGFIIAQTIRGFWDHQTLVFAPVILFQQEKAEIQGHGGAEAPRVYGGVVAVVGTNQTIFMASLANACGTRVALTMGLAYAVGGVAAGHPRSVAGDIGKEL
jgi:hypothetical protein